MKLHDYLKIPGNTQPKLRDRLIEITGRSITQGRISQWLKDGVTPEWIIPVAEATDWAVTPHEINADMYPHPDDGLPEDLRGPKAAAA